MNSWHTKFVAFQVQIARVFTTVYTKYSLQTIFCSHVLFTHFIKLKYLLRLHQICNFGSGQDEYCWKKPYIQDRILLEETKYTRQNIAGRNHKYKTEYCWKKPDIQDRTLLDKGRQKITARILTNNNRIPD